MRRQLFIALFLLAPTLVRAGEAEIVVANLLSAAWLPDTVRVEWQFRGKTPELLSSATDWTLAEPRPIRLAGAMIVTLQSRAAAESVEKIAVSGTARVFGSCLTVLRTVNSGSLLNSDNVSHIEFEWTKLTDKVLASLPSDSVAAARTLVPGRPILQRDVRPISKVQQGQSVTLIYAESGVKVRLAGRALSGGAVGDVIPVSVDLGKARTLNGRIAADGSLNWIR
jgi:flagella basal body P-ring formation protein FlgA